MHQQNALLQMYLEIIKLWEQGNDVKYRAQSKLITQYFLRFV